MLTSRTVIVECRRRRIYAATASGWQAQEDAKQPLRELAHAVLGGET